MNEPTTDEKIQQLVRSVLEAVDTRLDAVRHEVAAFAADVEQRHHQMLGTAASLERRLAELERAEERRLAAGSAGGTLPSTMTARLDEMGARLDLLARVATERMAPTPAHGMPMPESPPPLLPHSPPAPPMAPDHAPSGDLSAISKPLIDHAHVTTQIPIVPDPSIQRLTSLPIPAAVTPTMGPAPAPYDDVAPHDDPRPQHEELQDGDIDIDQLSALLTERLGHLGMPPHVD